MGECITAAKGQSIRVLCIFLPSFWVTWGGNNVVVVPSFALLSSTAAATIPNSTTCNALGMGGPLGNLHVQRAFLQRQWLHNDHFQTISLQEAFQMPIAQGQFTSLFIWDFVQHKISNFADMTRIQFCLAACFTMLTLPDYIAAVQVGMKLFGSCVWLQQMWAMFVFSIFPQEGDLFEQGVFILAGVEKVVAIPPCNLVFPLCCPCAGQTSQVLHWCFIM